MKLIRRTSFTKFKTIDTPVRCKWLKVIDIKKGHKSLVKNPNTQSQ